MALVSFFFERLGDEYFTWWSVQHMLPYGTGIMHVYSIFNLRLFFFHSFDTVFNLVLKRPTETVNGTSIS